MPLNKETKPNQTKPLNKKQITNIIFYILNCFYKMYTFSIYF